MSGISESVIDRINPAPRKVINRAIFSPLDKINIFIKGEFPVKVAYQAKFFRPYLQHIMRTPFVSSKLISGQSDNLPEEPAFDHPGPLSFRDFPSMVETEEL